MVIGGNWWGMSQFHDKLQQIKLYPEIGAELKKWSKRLPITVNRLGNIAIWKFMQTVKSDSDWLDGNEARIKHRSSK